MNDVNVVDVEVFEAVHGAWLTTKSAHVTPNVWPEQMAEMVATRDRIVALGGWTAGASTLLDVLELSRAEVANCRVIRWLLDPLSRHGIGARLVALLCDYVGAPITQPALARVFAEVTRNDTRADIVIEGLDNGRMLVIEAKIDAAEGERQADRLEQLWPDADVLAFLTVRGNRLPSTANDPERWRAISWRWFANHTMDLLADAEMPTNARTLGARRAAEEWATGTRRNLT